MKEFMTNKQVRSILLDMGRSYKMVGQQLAMTAQGGVRGEPFKCPVARYLRTVTGRRFSVLSQECSEQRPVMETWTNPYTGITAPRKVMREGDTVRLPAAVRAFIRRFDARKITI